MSELKEHIFSDIDEVFPRGYCGPLPSQEARPYYLKSEADKAIARHKYKRCLAMAMWCEASKNQLPFFGAILPKEEWFDKWHDRWLAIAEKFKEGV